MLEILEKKETKIIAVIIAVILVIIAGVILFNQNNLKQTKSSLEHEAGKSLTMNAQDYFDVDDKTAAEITFDISKVDVNTVGEYKATASYRNKNYTIEVNVVDTTAPKVNLAHRYVFTNDAANADITSILDSVYDASEYTVELVRFERSGNLSVMDEKSLNALVQTINTAATDEELKAVGTTEVPTEQGIYRGIVEVSDIYGNTAYEEIYVILDKEGARIEDVPDKVVEASAENLAAEPAVDKSEYQIKDNVDGKIATDDITCRLELRDEEKHEWLVYVSHVDRAGNESNATFLITVKEASTTTGNTQSTSQSGTSQGGNSSSQSGSGTANNGNSSNQGSSSNTETNKTPTNNQDTSTWVPTDDENVISPYMQMLIDAGYGNVVDWGNGSYGVLVHSDYTANGKYGLDILDEYLAARDLESVKSGAGIIDEDDDWYFYEVTEVRELITPDEEEFWD